MTTPDFEPDKWLKVRTDTAITARKFFGAPPDWPTRYAGKDENGLDVYEVKAEGLTVT